MPAKSAPQKPLKSWEEVDAALALLAKSEPLKTKLEAELAKQIQSLKDRYGERVKPLEEEIAGVTEQISEFVLAHKAELVDGKTATLTHGLVSLRLSPPKLATIKGTTWPKVLERIIALLPPRMRTKLVRTKEELDKEAIKTAIASGELADDKRKAIGITLTQTEEVYYELKAEAAS